MLAVVYVMFNEGFVSSTGATQDRDLAADAVWLAGVVATAVPHEAEAWGLAALLTIQHARAAARFDEDGGLVLLRHQDRSRWDARRDRRGRAADRAGRRPAAARPLPAAGRDRRPARDRARRGRRPTGSRSCCCTTRSPRHDPSPVVLLNQAVAQAQLGRARRRAGRARRRSPTALASYHLFHAARAELLTTLGRHDEAREANRTALGLTTNDAERRLLTTRLHRHPLARRVLRAGSASTRELGG